MIKVYISTLLSLLVIVMGQVSDRAGSGQFFSPWVGLVWDISRWEMGKGKNVGGKFPAGKRHWENGKNIPPKYRQFWDLN